MYDWLKKEIEVAKYDNELFKGVRTRNWWAILYPESARNDWLSVVRSWRVPCFVSPLHDRDVRLDGQPKKSHYHISVFFEGNKSYKQIKDLFDMIGGVMIEPINSMSGSSRYLCHMDDKDKTQYDPADVLAFAGANYQNACEARTDRVEGIKEMKSIIRRFNIRSFSVFCDYCEMHRPDLHYLLTSTCTVFIKEYISGRRWAQLNDCDRIVSSDGTILFDETWFDD